MAEEILDLLKNTPEAFVKATFEHCLNLKVNRATDQYADFMSRNYRHFQEIFRQIPLDREYQRKHQLINYFMMLVYLEVVISRFDVTNDTGTDVPRSENGRLAFWVAKFAQKIGQAEKRAQIDMDGPDGFDFRGKIKRVIENV